MSMAAMKWVLDDAPCATSADFATLVVFANFANEHGRCYPSTETVASKSRQNPKTVRAAIDRLEDCGLLVDTGARVGRTGNVKVYALGMEGIPKVGALPNERAPDAAEEPQEAAGASPAQALPKTGAFAGGAKAPKYGSKGTQKRVAEPVKEPLTPEDANASSAPKLGVRRSRGERIPDDWAAPAIADLPPDVAMIVRQWPAGAYETEARAFHRYRRSLANRGGRSTDWTAAWCARIAQLGSRPIRDGKAGMRFATEQSVSAAQPCAPADRGADLERSAALFDRMGRAGDAADLRRQAAALASGG